MPIRRVKGGFKIDNVKGKQPTRKMAVRQLAAIKIAQKKRKG